MNEYETTTTKSIILSNYCVECDSNDDDPRAAYIYNGNSYCDRHFIKAKHTKEMNDYINRKESKEV